jgi:hypothetical protein
MIGNLPPEAQKLVAEFVALLSRQYQHAPPARKSNQTKLSEGKFIGIWKDRVDMRDSNRYVRELREREWL